jgi:predicted metal-dependent enzyme (double-stranded beta helix superfamily)
MQSPTFSVSDLAHSLEESKQSAQNPQAAITKQIQLAIAKYGPEAIVAALEEAVPAGASVGEMIVFRSEHITMLYARIPPRFQSGIHDHTVFACIAQLTGAEKSVVYQPTEDGEGLQVTESVVSHLGDVTELAPDAIHHIENPTDEVAAALHVYGGDFSAIEDERSLWTHDHVRGPFSFEALMRHSVVAMTRDQNQRGLDGLVEAIPAVAKLVDSVQGG